MLRVATAVEGTGGGWASWIVWLLNSRPTDKQTVRASGILV